MKKCNLVLMTSGLVLFMSTVARADMPWQIVYQTKFATNQGWQTNNAENYYLDALENLGPDDGTGAYFTNQLECSDEDAYHKLPQVYGAGTPLRTEFDVRMDSFQYPGQLNISLNEPGKTTVGYPPKASITLSLSDAFKLQWADGIGPYEYPEDKGVHWEVWDSFGGTPVLGREYHAIVEWLPDKRTLSAWVTWDGGAYQTIDEVPTPGAFAGIDRITMSVVGDCNPEPGHGTGYFDNILVQTPEPATVLLLGLGGLVLRRRRR